MDQGDEKSAADVLSKIMQSSLSKNPVLADKQRRLLEALRNDPNLLRQPVKPTGAA